MAPYCNFKIQLFQYKIYHRSYAPWIRIGSNCCHQKLKNWRPGQIRDIRQRVSGSPTKTKESIQKTVFNLHLLQLDSRRGLTLNLKQFLICIWTLSIFTKLKSLKLENKLFFSRESQNSMSNIEVIKKKFKLDLRKPYCHRQNTTRLNSLRIL